MEPELHRYDWPLVVEFNLQPLSPGGGPGVGLKVPIH